MIQRYVDPSKINVAGDCIEVDEVYAGERVEGYTLKGFELVEVSNYFEDGIEIVYPGKSDQVSLKDLEISHIGFHILVDGLSEESASALESLIGEVINKIKGVECRFRKEHIVVKISEDTFSRLTLDCIGEILYESFRKIPVINRVRVRIIADEGEFKKLIEHSKRIHEAREESFRRTEEEVDRFYICTSCQYHLPNHGCVISPERPSPCGTTWVEAKAAEELGIVNYYSGVEKGEKIDEGEFSGVNKTLNLKTGGKIGRVSIHSVLNNPPSTGLYPELIIFYDPDRDAFGIVDRDYNGKTPIGLTFDEMEKIIIGQQVQGFVGISYAYLKSKKFLKREGGWKRVYWVSPNVYNYIKDFLDRNSLAKIITC
jgi:acetyl-CoA decarbonylase/synthase complex subunit beta